MVKIFKELKLTATLTGVTSHSFTKYQNTSRCGGWFGHPWKTGWEKHINFIVDGKHFFGIEILGIQCIVPTYI